MVPPEGKKFVNGFEAECSHVSGMSVPLAAPMEIRVSAPHQ
jgi:hypothetical protein